MRNFSDLDQGLRELARVVRPGGHVVILEMTTPQRPPLSTFFKLWFDRVVPVLGRARGRLRRLHLPARTRCAVSRARRQLAAQMAAAGLGDIRYVLTAGGIIALHVGTVVA